jgi:hypothetical protein
MRLSRVVRLAARELRRSVRHFGLASIGVVVGVAAFSFFLALGLGVRHVVLEKVFAMDELEVVPRRVNFDVGRLRLDAGRDTLDDAAATKLAALDGVEAVYPKMKLVVPAVGEGGQSLFGSDLRMELAVDGIDPSLVREDVGRAFRFAAAEEHPMHGKSCEADDGCGTGAWCADLECRAMVPVLVSHHLIEVYNGTLSRVHQLPKISDEALNGFTFEMEVGRSMVSSASLPEYRTARAIIVGISRKALPLGITVPLSYVEGFNSELEGDHAARAYHSVVVQAEHESQLGDVATGIIDLGFEVSDRGAERAAMIIAVFMVVFGLVASVIVFISAVNVMHVLLMLVAQRERELGVFRALGATRRDVRRLIMAEAATLGLVAAALGLALAYAGAAGFDVVSTRYVPDFPYKPDTYFAFPWWLWIVSLVFASGFCSLGALVPAIRAARMDPARVLSGRS